MYNFSIEYVKNLEICTVKNFVLHKKKIYLFFGSSISEEKESEITVFYSTLRGLFTYVHLSEIIIAIRTVKTVFKFRLGRCSPIGDAFPAKIPPWNRDLAQNNRFSPMRGVH